MARRSRYSPTSYQSAKRQLIIGAVLLVIGLVVTVGSYSAASSSRTGGTYIVSWGPMIFGFLRVVTALPVLVRSRGQGAPAVPSPGMPNPGMPGPGMPNPGMAGPGIPGTGQAPGGQWAAQPVNQWGPAAAGWPAQPSPAASGLFGSPVSAAPGTTGAPGPVPGAAGQGLLGPAGAVAGVPVGAPVAGWYADPAGTSQYRWWDGRSWTDQVR